MRRLALRTLFERLVVTTLLLAAACGNGPRCNTPPTQTANLDAGLEVSATFDDSDGGAHTFLPSDNPISLDDCLQLCPPGLAHGAGESVVCEARLDAQQMPAVFCATEVNVSCHGRRPRKLARYADGLWIRPSGARAHDRRARP